MLDASKAGLRQLDDSDNTIFIYDNPSSKETFAVGVYVDNLQLVHSVPIDKDGNAADPDSYLARFLNLLRADWEVINLTSLLNRVRTAHSNRAKASASHTSFS